MNLIFPSSLPLFGQGVLPADELKRIKSILEWKHRVFFIELESEIKSDSTFSLLSFLREKKLIQDETALIAGNASQVNLGHEAKIQTVIILDPKKNIEINDSKAWKELVDSEPEGFLYSIEDLLRYSEKLAIAESRYFPIATVGGLIFDEDGKILLTQTRKWSNLYGIPGGKIDYGETMEAAFIREAREETGLEIFDVEFVMNQDCIEHVQFYKPRHYILVNYRAKVKGKMPPIKLNYESEKFLWVGLDEAMKLALNEPTEILLKKVLAN